MQADVKALRLERRKVAQERKQEAEQREAFEKQLRAKAEKTSQVEKGAWQDGGCSAEAA